MNVVVPLIASLVSLFFALAVLDQFLARRRVYQLVWAVGLLNFFVGTGCEFLSEAFGRDPTTFRLWYLFGAVFGAAYLGMGTLYLLAPRRVANIIMALLLMASIYAIYTVFTAQVNLEVISSEATLSGKAFPSGVDSPRFLTPFFNTFGTVALIGGALYSAWVFWRHRIMSHRVISNVLIAGGALLPALGGTFARLGVPELLYLSELVGVIVIFIGFLRSREIFGLYRIPLIHGPRRVPD